GPWQRCNIDRGGPPRAQAATFCVFRSRGSRLLPRPGDHPVIPLRRTILAFAVTFVCALLVFTLPRFTWNSVQAAINPQQAAAPGAAAVSAPAPDPQAAVPPVAARSVAARPVGVFGPAETV